MNNNLKEGFFIKSGAFLIVTSDKLCRFKTC